MDVRVKLLAYDVWVAEDDKMGFLSIGVDIFDQLYLKELPISLPKVKNIGIKRNYENEDNWKSSTNRNMRFFYEWSKYYVWLNPPYRKTWKIENINQLILTNVQNNVLDAPFLLKEYNLFSQNTESSLEQ